MKPLLAGSAAALAILVPALPCQDTPPQDLSTKVDRLFKSWNNKKKPGAAVLVVQNGKIVHRRGYGMANLEHGIPIGPETVFDIASVSKQFCGLAIAMLAEQGKLSLDDDVRKHVDWVPDFGKKITIRHLLHHASGLRDWPGALRIAGWRFDDVISFQQILNLIRHQRDLNFEPGAEYLYSNTGYNLLAHVVEKVSGQSFAKWTKAHIFDPLGMKHTHFHDDHSRVVENRAVAYAQKRGRAAASRWRNIGNHLTALGSSSLYTTIDDLGRWILNFETYKVAGKKALEAMHTRGKLNNGRRIAYCYGVSTGNYRGLRTVSHGGSWAGFKATLIRFPKQRFAVVVLANTAAINSGRMAYRITNLYLKDQLADEPDKSKGGDIQGKPAPLPQVAKVDPAIYKRYTGVYELSATSFVTIHIRDGRLFGRLDSQREAEILPASTTRFFARSPRVDVTFHQQGDGKATGLTVKHRGEVAKGKRVTASSPADMDGYVGEYRSPELHTSYRIERKDKQLILRHYRNEDVILTRQPVRDLFAGSAWWARQLRFLRDEKAKVIGFVITNGRCRNVRFDQNG